MLIIAIKTIKHPVTVFIPATYDVPLAKCSGQSSVLFILFDLTAIFDKAAHSLVLETFHHLTSRTQVSWFFHYLIATIMYIYITHKPNIILLTHML